MGASAFPGMQMASGHSSFDPRKNPDRAREMARGGVAGLALGMKEIKPRNFSGQTPVQPGGQAPQSTRQAPTSILGSQPAPNARSTGRSLIKDPVAQGSLLA